MLLDQYFPRDNGEASVIIAEACHGQFSTLGRFKEAKRQGLGMPKTVKIQGSLPMPVKKYRAIRYN